MSKSDAKTWNSLRMDACGLAVILGLTAIGYFAQIGPALDAREQAQAQSTHLTAEQSRARELERSLFKVKDELDIAQRAAAKSELKLERVTGLNDRLARLTDLAGGLGLQVDTIESGATTNFDRYATVAIRISGRGSYRNCAALLKQFRESMPDLGVASVQLTSGGVTDGANANFNLELLWYTQPTARTTKK